MLQIKCFITYGWDWLFMYFISIFEIGSDVNTVRITTEKDDNKSPYQTIEYSNSDTEVGYYRWYFVS